MSAGVVEILGLFLALVGAGAVVAAASRVSVALATLAAGGFLLLAGVLLVYVAVGLDRAARAAQAERRRTPGDVA